MTSSGAASSPSPATPAPVSPLPVAPPVASPAPVEFSFEYTFDELREGLTQSPESQQLQKRQRSVGRLFGWVLFVSLAVMFFLLLNQRGRMGGAPRAVPITLTPPPPTVDPFIAAGPSLLVATLVGILITALAIAVYLMTEKTQKARESGAQWPTLGVLMVIFVGGVGAAVLISPGESGGWAVSYKQAMILALLPWVVVVAMGVGFAVWLSRANLQRQWNSKPALQRRRTIVLDDAGEHLSDGIVDQFYRWPYFRRAWETPHTLVLLDENDLRHIFPKRVMDQATLDRARAVISNHVDNCTFLTAPGGFPVAPAPALPPETSPAAAPPVR